MPRFPAQRYRRSTEFDVRPDDAQAVSSLSAKCRFQTNGRGQVWGVVASAKFSDEEVAAFCKLPHLVSVIFGWSPNGKHSLTAHGFSQLAHLQKLKAVFSQGNKNLDDTAAMEAVHFERLDHLMLPFCGITDVGMRHLARMDRLLSLSLIGNDISDESVPYLCRLNSLRRLFVDDTRITQDGIAELQRFLTKCRTLSTHDS